MEYRPATGNILFCLLFLGIGLLAFLGLGVFWYLKGFFLNAYMLLPVVFGSVFVFFGGAFLYRDMVLTRIRPRPRILQEGKQKESFRGYPCPSVDPRRMHVRRG